MKIQSVHIRNFRKLKNCHIDFGERETVFVGANNSGKTSAISAIVWFLKNTERFTLKEFTATNWSLINDLGEKWLEKESVDESLLDPHKWDEIVPSMDVWIHVNDGEQYRVNHLIPSLSTWEGKIVGVRGQYVPKEVETLYSDFKKAKIKAAALKATEEYAVASSPELYPLNLCDFLGKGSNLRKYFDVKYYIIDTALDPTEEDAVQKTPDEELDNNPLDKLIRVDTILASRDFSDPEGQPDNDIDTLSRQFQQYYKNRVLEEDLTSEDLVLIGGISKANEIYDEKLRRTFEEPVGELKNINYPGFQNPMIKIRSKIQIEEAIKHDSAVQFAIHGMEDLTLPEKYNGLGYRNLISIYLRLIDFRDRWLSKLSDEENIEPIHIVFIEEPEAHLHAQAQQVFVKKAFDALCNSKLIEDNPWLSTQLVLSTHSNHVVNELDLNSMRYFRRAWDDESKLPVSKVVNLSSTFGSDKETQQFVTRYIRLTHYDIFFSDATIFVEGPAEKILIPGFLSKGGMDSYYISVIEINGRHAHRFRKLIERLGIPTLIVTDIDATDTIIGKDGKKTHPSVVTAKGKGYETGNPSIVDWLPAIRKIDDLLLLNSKDKLKENVRIAFQTPATVKWNKEDARETEICPYTFEDALIFTNLELFKMEEFKKLGTITTVANLVKNSKSANDLQEKIFKKLESKGGFSKADFAISLLYNDKLFDILIPPRYIQEGLDWLKSFLDSNENKNGE